MSADLAGFLQNSWELILLIATWAGIAVVAIRARRDWRQRRFTSQVNFSLNLLAQGADGKTTLILRTLLEWCRQRLAERLRRQAGAAGRAEDHDR